MESNFEFPSTKVFCSWFGIDFNVPIEKNLQGNKLYCEARRYRISFYPDDVLLFENLYEENNLDGMGNDK